MKIHRMVCSLALLVLLGTVTACRGTDEAAVPATAPATPTATALPEPTAIADPTLVPVIDPAEWPAAEPGTIRVDAGLRSGPISPLLYGTNFGPWISVPVDLKDEAVGAGLTFLRWPGGEYGDRNNVRPEQIDQFVKLARELGTEPSIHVRLLNGTPEQAAELVRYANIEKGYGLKYWAIGNEPNLYPDGEDDIDKVNANWRAIAEAMLAVDPDILLLGPEVTGYLPGTVTDDFTTEARAMTAAFLEANGDLVNIVTIHRYPLPPNMNSPRPTAAELAATTPEWDGMLSDLRAMIREKTGRDIPIGVTEFNANWSKQAGGEGTPDSIAGAVWLVDVLGRMIRQRVEIGAHFALQSGTSQGAWGLLDRFAVRPQYYVYPFMTHFGRELVAATVDEGQQNVTAYAALNDDGALTLLIVNRGEEPVDLFLRLAGHPGGEAEYYRLDAERVAAGTVADVVGTTMVEDGIGLSVVPLSATLYVLSQ